MDQTIINFEVYEDGVEYLGLAEATLPDLSALTQSLSGAGIAGKIEFPVLGHYDAMSLTLNFRTFNKEAVKLAAPARHNIDLRVAQQVENPVSGEIEVQGVKHVMVVVPKSLKSGSVAPASPSNGSGEYAVHYWKTTIDGKTVLEIDPLNYICKINGTDYLKDVKSALGK